MNKERTEREAYLKENERYPLNSLTRDQLARFNQWEKNQEAAAKRAATIRAKEREEED